jgi:hypothetical protein
MSQSSGPFMAIVLFILGCVVMLKWLDEIYCFLSNRRLRKNHKRIKFGAFWPEPKTVGDKIMLRICEIGAVAMTSLMLGQMYHG